MKVQQASSLRHTVKQRSLRLSAAAGFALVIACGESEHPAPRQGASGSSSTAGSLASSIGGAGAMNALATGGVGGGAHGGAPGRAGAAGASTFACGQRSCTVGAQYCSHQQPTTSGSQELFDCVAFESSCAVHDCSCFCTPAPTDCQLGTACNCALADGNVTFTCYEAGPVP